MRSHASRPIGLAAATLTGALALAACGSSHQTSHTAGVDPGLAMARCMRAHGVPNFPDPGSRGTIEITPGSGIDPRSPAFQTAQQACRRYLPGKLSPGPVSESSMRAAFAFAKCMRAHGQSNFPDPIRTAQPGSGPAIVLRGMVFPVGAGFDPRSPAFRQAASQCGLPLPPPGSARAFKAP